MEKDLKMQNVPWLTAIYTGVLIVLAIVQWSMEQVFGVSIQFDQQVVVVAAITSFGGVFSHFLPNSVKHPLIYMRLHNVLSGHRCRRICTRDPRFRSADLERRWPNLFLREMAESEQNSYWYNEIYRPVRNKPEVVQAHRSFLLFRDASAGLFLLLLGLILWKAVGEVMPIPSLNTWSVVILGGMVLLLCQAARQSGDRMVANAVAVALND